MKLGLSGMSASDHLPYATAVNNAALAQGFWPLVIYSIAFRETIVAQQNHTITSAAYCVSFDGGHGLCQLTSSYPDQWCDPETNAAYAIKFFLYPAVQFWSVEGYNFTGTNLLRCIAAEYNAGRNAAVAGHVRGNVDLYTSGNYASAVEGYYITLLNKGTPL